MPLGCCLDFDNNNNLALSSVDAARMTTLAFASYVV